MDTSPQVASKIYTKTLSDFATSSDFTNTADLTVTTESFHVMFIEDEDLLHTIYLILLFITTLAGNIGKLNYQ